MVSVHEDRTMNARAVHKTPDEGPQLNKENTSTSMEQLDVFMRPLGNGIFPKGHELILAIRY